MSTTACVQCHVDGCEGSWLCNNCVATLKRWLLELAGHAVDLEEAVIPGLTSRRGEKVQVTGSTEAPQQWNEDASTAAETLRSDLVSIARDLCEARGTMYDSLAYLPLDFIGPLPRNGVRSEAPYAKGSTSGVAMWLAHYVMSIALSSDALETYGTVESLAVGYMSVTDEGMDVWKRSVVLCAVDITLPRVWLGRCDAVVDGAVCGMDVRATEDDTAVRCGCMTVHNVAEFKVRVLATAGGELATGPVLLGLIGGALKAGTLRQWKARGKVKPAMVVDGVDVWRIGEVLALVAGSGEVEAA